MFSVIDVHESGDGLTYVEDVFSAFTYEGNSSTRDIVNGIDLAGKGGLVWTKRRNTTTFDHALFDTARGVRKYISSNLTNAEVTAPAGNYDLYAFNSDGYSIADYNSNINQNAGQYIGWTFRKAKKFFDVKTYTGNGVSGRQIAHDLGVAPGMIIVKRLDAAANWVTYHRSFSAQYYAFLNTTDAALGPSSAMFPAAPTDTVFTTGSNVAINSDGAQYVAYIFAHDDSADGIIQCGTFTGSTADVNLGWEAQYVLVKKSSSTGSWFIFDTSRGWNLSTADKALLAENSGAEFDVSLGNPTSSGFNIPFGGSDTYVYMAIRKGLMRPPTDASKVFDIVARTGTGAAATITTPGIKTGVDLAITKSRGSTREHSWQDRLRGVASQISSSSNAAETTEATRVTSFNMDGVTLGNRNVVNTSAEAYINYFFKQARGFLDVVNYKGTQIARTIPHNLGVAPELMIVKNLPVASDLVVFSAPRTALRYSVLNTTAADLTNSGTWNDTMPTDAAFSLGNGIPTNETGRSFIAYLFASCPGVSKIGIYTGTGAAQNINCGFAAGARFVMIKRIDSTGNWRYADSTRGIISGNDPYLLFNSTAAEVTSADYLAPLSSGFTVNGSDSDVNASGGTYLYLSVA